MSESNYPRLDIGVSLVESALYLPIPNMDELRERKRGYSELPIDAQHPRFIEPIVDIATYGIAGQAYYSRPNAVTGEPIPEVPKELYLRKSVAETLAKINSALRADTISEIFGGEVELYVEDALRAQSLQTQLHDEFIPRLLRTNDPEVSDIDLQKRLADIIALPSDDPKKPSPHATGGVIDVILRYKNTNPGYVAGSSVEMGHIDGETSSRINPDYFEYNQPITTEERLAQRHRRAFYAIMTGSALSFDTGLVFNPSEWWHCGRGDQLSEKVRGSNFAYYSIPDTVSTRR